MGLRGSDIDRGRAKRARSAFLAAVLATLLSTTAALAASDRSAATITGSFPDSCRDFTTHAYKVGSQQGKDISHVVLHYADGRVVKEETIDSPERSIDGGPGDELDSVDVKAGTTTETFTCQRPNGPPTALLEIETPEGFCFTWDDGLVDCDGRIARTAWTHSTMPDLGYGIVRFFCGWPDDQSCVDHVMPCGQKDFYSLCVITYSFRGTSSTDPDGDIVSWSIDFGDGTFASGDWATNPPTEVSHEYQRWHCPLCEFEPATLTVTDSAGQSASDAQLPLHEYPE
jgi:hypothetical protein